ncbi:MAG: Rnase Y domain-containing protein [bacterium]|nr:Rnase Y domain-containing protein [bacterium]
MERVKEAEEELLAEAKKKADQVIEQAEIKAQKIEDQRLAKMEEIQNRLLMREEKMDQKLERLEEEKTKILEKQREADEVILAQKEKLAQIANITPEDAKAQIIERIEAEHQEELIRYIEKFKTIKTEEAQREAAMIIAQSLPKVAADTVSEFTSKMIDLPSEEFKGKLIGREGRNISLFEKLTGVELLIDDTPLSVRISSFDSEKRFIAAKTLELLIKDGRINPFYIEKVYNQVVADLQLTLMEKGKEALSVLNLPMMKPDMVKTIGQFFLRYSYGQNLWIHSLEVAKTAEMIAIELGLDATLAKKAGLLHDVGKVAAGAGESHTKVGADMLRKRGMDPVIINAAESHHYDVEMTHPISWIVAAADAMSASRPGARFDTKDFFIEKMGELEKLIVEVEGVEKVHIMQAGREIMVFVNPKLISDLQVEGLLKTIGEKIEEQLDYPGIIRITALRETKLIQYLR